MIREDLCTEIMRAPTVIIIDAAMMIFSLPTRLETYEGDHWIHVCANIQLTSQTTFPTDVIILLVTLSSSSLSNIRTYVAM